MDCLLLFHAFFCCCGLFPLQWNCTRKILLHHMQQAVSLEDFCTIMNTSAQLVKLCTPQCMWFLKWLALQKNDFFLAPKYVLLQSNSWMSKGYGNPGRVYIFSAMLNSLWNWASHNRYWLRPSTPVLIIQQTATSSKNNIIKFARIWPLTLNYNKISWNCQGVPDETTCLTVLFGVPAP